MRAAVYARVSAMPADEVKDSVPQQVSEGLATVERKGWTLVGEPFVDHSISAWDGGTKGRGKPKERPAWNAILELAGAGSLDVVVVRHVDRLLRNPQARADVRRVGLQVADHSGNVISDFALGIMAEVATYESDVRSDRQLKAEDRRIASGLPPRGGHRHFGYHRGCCDDCAPHTPKDDEVEVIHELAARWLAGEPMRALARELNERGITTTRGGEWNHQSLKKMLLSPRLAGIRVHRRNGETVEHRGTWEPVVSRDLHARLVNADGGAGTRRAPQRYPLTGLLVCGPCSDADDERWVTLNGHQHRPKQRRYACLTCRRNGIGAEPVEAALWNAALGRTWHRDQRAERTVADELKAVTADLRRARAKLVELEDDYWSERPTVTKQAYARRGTKLRETVAALEADAERLRSERAAVGGFWRSLVALADEYRDAPSERRREVLEGAVRRVILAPAAGGRGGRVDLSRLRVEWADGEVTEGADLEAVVG